MSGSTFCLKCIRLEKKLKLYEGRRHFTLFGWSVFRFSRRILPIISRSQKLMAWGPGWQHEAPPAAWSGSSQGRSDAAGDIGHPTQPMRGLYWMYWPIRGSITSVIIGTGDETGRSCLSSVSQVTQVSTRGARIYFSIELISVLWARKKLISILWSLAMLTQVCVVKICYRYKNIVFFYLAKASQQRQAI